MKNRTTWWLRVDFARARHVCNTVLGNKLSNTSFHSLYFNQDLLDTTVLKLQMKTLAICHCVFSLIINDILCFCYVYTSTCLFPCLPKCYKYNEYFTKVNFDNSFCLIWDLSCVLYDWYSKSYAPFSFLFFWVGSALL